MFYYLKGKLVKKIDNLAVVDVGGVGFKVYTPSSRLANINSDDVIFYTYMHIREDIMDIYGFLTEEELSFFQKLISVSGVGPKAALSILSTISPSDLLVAILSSDSKKIAKTPGVGQKTAQRIILELKGKFKDDEIGESLVSFDNSNGNEAVSALIALGYSQQEAAQAVSSAGETDSVEETIKVALKLLMR